MQWQLVLFCHIWVVDMIRNKPTIKLYANTNDQKIVSEICAGMEEEGVPFEIEIQEGLELVTLCYNASTDSVLGIGIGIKDTQVGIQISPLPRGRVLFQIENPTMQQARILGMNAARAVKKMPFKPL